MLEDSGEGQTCNLTTELSRLSQQTVQENTERRKEGADGGAYTASAWPGKERQQSTRTLALTDGPGWARGAQSHDSLKMVLVVGFIFRR